MDVDHVAFAGLRKFDGKRTRWLHAAGDRPDRRPRRPLPHATAPSASPASADDMDDDLVEAVEDHRFEPVAGGRVAQRQARLRLPAATCCARWPTPPEREGLKLSGRGAGRDHPAAPGRGRGRRRTAPATAPACMRLWDVCQTPDFRKTDAGRARAAWSRTFFDAPDRAAAAASPRTGSPASSPALDRTDGEIDALAAAAGRRAHPGLCRQPPRLAARPGALAGHDPGAGGPALRHPAREADGPVRRPADQRPDARPARARGRCWPASPPTAR